jgi:Putative peptidoglycan binding domain
MRLHYFVAGLVAAGLFASQPDAWAHGGGGGGGGRGGGGGGHWHGGYGGRGYGGRGYYRGRYYGYGRGYGYGYGFYGYPWWGPWWGPWGGWDYGYYPYYGYDSGYDSGYYSSSDPPSNSGSAPQFNTARAVQAALAWRGFYSGRIDGVMGPETRSAIRDFQRQQGLPVTGQIDSELTKALQRRN